MKSKLLFFIFLVSFLIGGSLLYTFFLEMYKGEFNVELRMSGRVAMIFLTGTLLITPISTYISHKKFRDIFTRLRKILGLSGFYFFLFHLFQYSSIEWVFHTKFHSDISFLSYFFENIWNRPDALSGLFAGVIMTLLGCTSNIFLMSKLGGKLWKNIQTLVYPLFLLTLIHVAFASRFDMFYMSLTTLLVVVRALAYFHTSTIQQGSSGDNITRYLCVPCGYIYDEANGDPDSGILPGTRFVDIPDNWRCPVCGVSKKDFIPLGGTQALTEKQTPNASSENSGVLQKKEMLTSNVVELVISTVFPIRALPGQFVSLIFSDHDGEFRRSYSVVHQSENQFTLVIKLTEYGRGSRILRDMKLGDRFKVQGPFGQFILRNTPVTKVFLATGTGLSPMIHMLECAPKNIRKILYVGAEKSADLFYRDQLSKIENLEINVYLSREETSQYQFGRIDSSKFDYPIDTEFYICGNPGLVNDSTKKLEEKGYKQVFHEVFA